jgi:serine/threonine protein kinase
MDSTDDQEPSSATNDEQSAALDDTLPQDEASLERSRTFSRGQPGPPVTIPGYDFVTCLGEGAYGVVWQACERNTGRQVAIKFYTHRRGLDWSLLSREVEKLAVLSTSRNIVRLLEVGWDSTPPYYVMEYLENGSLAAFLEEGSLPVHEAIRITRSVLQALVHAHGSGILHCDLKPANVLLDADYAPRICDFGQSRLSSEQEPALGTLFYMAPEQADLKAIPDARWDVYALGALLYQMLCGQTPHRTAQNETRLREANTLDDKLAVYREILEGSPKPNEHRKIPGVDRRLAEIVDRCLQVDPAKRYPNAQAVVDKLELRKRQRARRPLVALGILGPGLLLAAMTPIVGDAMRSVVNTAEQNLTARALESDSIASRILAQSLERELADRRLELVDIAAAPAVRAAIIASSSKTWEQRTELRDVLEDWKQKVDDNRRSEHRELDTSWFVTDNTGVQLWRAPYDPNTIDHKYDYREYFNGVRAYSPDQRPDNLEPLSKPHVSREFRSQATNRYMVAISVPVRDETGKIIGVLARTSHLGELLAEYEQSIQGDSTDGVNRVIALVDVRSGRLLDHPWMTKQHLENIPDVTFRKLAVSDEVTRRLQRLGKREKTSKTSGFDDRIDAFEDPVGHINMPATKRYREQRLAALRYRGQWLAAFSPVGRTGWAAVVQERRASALYPIEEMRGNILRYGIWALLVGCGLIGLLWYFVSRALNEQGLRFWSTRGGQGIGEVRNRTEDDT